MEKIEIKREEIDWIIMVITELVYCPGVIL